MISLELVRQCLKGRCQGNQVLLILMHEFRWMQAASGTAGLAFALHLVQQLYFYGWNHAV